LIHRLYHLATRIGQPAILLLLHQRKKLGKEDAHRFAERRGIASLPRPSGPLIWLHGASVGESQALLPLIDRLAKTGQATILLTTGTVTSARLLAMRLPGNAIHQYVPVDHPDWAKAFLDHWQPDLALWSESDFWPNLLELTHQRQIPMVLVQGRVSPRSFANWLKIPSFIGHILGHFDLCLAQSPADADRLSRLGAHGVNYLGNLKQSVPPLPADPDHMAQIAGLIDHRPVWVAASTHPGEEAVAARVHASLKARHPNLLTIIIPRHPTRAAAIAEQILKMGLTLAIRSQDHPLSPTTDIYLVDSIGELGLFFRVSPLVFMGKSLCVEGGQNPFEPALLGAAILFGPLMTNFVEMCQSLLAEHAAIQIEDEQQLMDQLDHLLTHPQAIASLGKAALAWAAREAGILDRFIRTLAPFLDRLNVRP
jgi:3-deoxy-D-manno-octulosonic-acid transferase